MMPAGMNSRVTNLHRHGAGVQLEVCEVQLP
jgi:hypothetical protein